MEEFKDKKSTPDVMYDYPVADVNGHKAAIIVDNGELLCFCQQRVSCLIV